MTKPVQTIREVTNQEQKSWDHIADHPLQSWAWGDFRASMGIDVVRLGLYEGDILAETYEITFHPVPHTTWTIGYIPKSASPSKQMIDALTKLGKKKNAIFIQLEPNIRTDSRFMIQDSRVKSSHHPLFTKYTFVLDLTKSEEELLANMHSKTRYNIKVAQKHGVIVREDNSPKAFEAYLGLSQETTQRQGFFAHSKHYHQTMWNTLYKAGIAHLFTASYKGQILATWILFRWKNTLYYPYGASSRDHRETMAPTLLLWEIIRWAKGKNLQSFDLWGALGPVPDTQDPWYGFHRFKEGFRPTLVEFVGSYDLIIKPQAYQLYKIADTIRWKMLKFRT